MENFYTYLYTDPSRNEPIYVGKGTKQRAYWHLTRTDKHPLTSRLINLRRKGIEPVISFLVENVDEEFALLVEEEAIDKFGRKDLGKGPLLNLTDGGDGISGLVFTDEYRSKLSTSLKTFYSSDSGRRLASDRAKKWFSDPINKENHRDSMRIANQRPEVISKAKKTRKKTSTSNAFKQNMSNAIRTSWKEESVRNKRMAGLILSKTEAYKENLAIAVKNQKKRKWQSTNNISAYKNALAYGKGGKIGWGNTAKKFSVNPDRLKDFADGKNLDWLETE